jgi:hypothetical protein
MTERFLNEWAYHIYDGKHRCDMYLNEEDDDYEGEFDLLEMRKQTVSHWLTVCFLVHRMGNS